MKVLVSAYACEPDKGSEPGAGWNWALAAARNHEVWVLTRANNRPAIEEALACEPDPPLHFVYLDLPRWARFWKRGQRGIRVYYSLWQLLAARAARRLHREREFDVVHHMTFATVWLPALACLAGARFVLGPVGGGPRVPLRLYPSLGALGALRELWLESARLLSRLNPLVRLAWRRAALILVQNEETRRALPRRYREKCVVRPNASVSETVTPPRSERTPRPVAVYAGQLLPWKGVSLAIRALRLLPAWELLIIGEGPDAGRLRRLVDRLGLSARVRFLPWLPRAELWRQLASCRALAFPSLREDAGFVAVEAQMLGLPVVAFDQGGPSALARVPGARYHFVPRGSARECVRALAGALQRAATAPVTEARPDFGLAGVARDVDAAYRRACSPSLLATAEALS